MIVWNQGPTQPNSERDGIMAFKKSPLSPPPPSAPSPSYSIKKKQTDMFTLKTDKKQSTGYLNNHESYNGEKRPGDEVDPTKVLKELC